MRSYKRGFTLIELLVVVSIIGLLSSIVLTSLNTARVNARNASRNAAIEQLRTALMLGIGATGLPASNGWSCVSATCYGGWGSVPANATVDAYLSGNIQKPVDPSVGNRGGGGYAYIDPTAGALAPGFPAGYYLNWLLEAVPVTSNVCGPGRVYTANADFIQCLLLIN